MAVRTYDPKQVLIIIGGNAITGFADGSFVTVARNEDMWTLQVGTDGEGTRSKSNNKSGTITFQLMQSSDSNQVLSALAAVDELSGAGAVPVMVKDNSGDSIYVAETGWIRKYADSEFAREAGPREWVVETDVLVLNVAGN